ncbi:MAG: DUF2975 domain-containing protein [Bacteroidales bacterium]|nr:DUF2975 domain-containing protein [Bacteroidales bacterium]
MANKFPFIKSINFVLQIIWYLQLLFLFALIVVSVLIITDSPIVDRYKLKGFRVQFQRINLDKSIAGSTIYLSNGEGRLHNTKTGDKFILYRIFSVFVDAFLYTLIVLWLKKVFKCLESGDFFIRKNGVYIKRIAYAVIGITLLPDLIDYFINLQVANVLKIDNLIFKARLNFDFRSLFLALLLFVIAKVFIKGAEIKEENDLTI